MSTYIVRDTALRKRLRKHYARIGAMCGICEGEIDYSLHHMDPMAGVVDHVIPLNRGGPDIAENCQAAHRSCNRSKSDRVPGDERPAQPRTYVTWRTW